MKKTLRYSFFVILVFSIFGCSTVPPTVSPEQLRTSVAKALIETQSVFTPTPQITNTPSPTSTPRPSSTPRPTATPKYGVLTAPFPFGESISLQYTSGNNDSKYTFQILDVIRGDEANKLAKRANMFNDDPPEGMSWMFIKVKATLDSGDAFKLSTYDIAVISGGQIFDGYVSVCCTTDIGYPELDATLALPGATTEGWIIEPVFISDDKPLIAMNISSFDPNLDDGLFFALYK